MAINILNVSIDPPDVSMAYHPEDLSYNDIESINEALLEKVLMINNAIPEHDEPDTNGKDGQAVKKGSCHWEIKLVHTVSGNQQFTVVTYIDTGAHVLLVYNSSIIKFVDRNKLFFNNNYIETLKPPPQAFLS
jgi:hypothetical protein